MQRNVETDLDYLYDTFGQKIIPQEIAQYLIEIIQNDTKVNKVILANRLIHFLPDCLLCNFLPQPGSDRPIDTIRAIFYGYWTVLSHLEEGRNYFTEQNQEPLLALIKLVNQTKSSYFNLAGSILSDVSFHNIDLRSIKLCNAELDEAHLYQAYLVGANLSHANLSRSNVIFSVIAESNLDNANLSESYISGSFFFGSSLREANLHRSSLRGADLQDVNLSRADLSEADLNKVDLSYSNLSYTKLKGAKNLTLKQLQSVRTLYNCTGLPPKMEAKLRQTHPQLFEEPKNKDHLSE